MKIPRILESSCKTVAKGHFWERTTERGHSSAGRALRWQRRGQGFDPPWLHQIIFNFSHPHLIIQEP